MQREIDIQYPDGAIHSVSVYRADVTYDNRVVISYYDISNRMVNSYTEIRQVDGEFYKVLEHLEWEEYEQNFQPFNQGLSDSIIRALNDTLNIYTPHARKIVDENPRPIALTQAAMVNPPDIHKRGLYQINSVLFANGHKSRINLNAFKTKDGKTVQQRYDLLACCAFFNRPIFKNEPMTEDFHRFKVDKADRYDIINYLINLYGDSFDVSDIPDRLRIPCSSGNIFLVTFSSCDDWKLFLNVQGADRLTVYEQNISDITYPDYLSSALHYELPLDISINGIVRTNGVDPITDRPPHM